MAVSDGLSERLAAGADEDSSWSPTWITCALNATIDGAAVCAIDGLVSESQRRELLGFLTGDLEDEVAAAETEEPNPTRWDKKTSDAVGLPPSFGLRQELLRSLESAPSKAVRQIQRRLERLYPEYEIRPMPNFREGGGSGEGGGRVDGSG